MAGRFVDHAVAALTPLGAVWSRAMFGAHEAHSTAVPDFLTVSDC